MKPENILETDFLRSRAVEYIQKFITRPYKWGGNDPMEGFDCSGLIHEVLQSVGLEKHGLDCTAHDLYLTIKSETRILDKPRFGALVFWFRDGKAIHVAMLVNEFQICEAGGGGADTLTEEDAKRRNAYVRIRPLDYRGENYKILDPFEGWEE